MLPLMCGATDLVGSARNRLVVEGTRLTVAEKRKVAWREKKGEFCIGCYYLYSFN